MEPPKCVPGKALSENHGSVSSFKSAILHTTITAKYHVRKNPSQ